MQEIREKIHPTCTCKKETTLPHWKSPKTLPWFLRMRMGGWGREDVCPSTSGCTSGGCFWYRTHLLLWHHKTRYQTHRWARHHDASCSHPVDIAMFSLPPALLLSPPKCLFLFHFQRDIFFKMPNAGFWLLFTGSLLGAAINCKRFEVGSSSRNRCWVLCCFFCRGSFSFPLPRGRSTLGFCLASRHSVVYLH